MKTIILIDETASGLAQSFNNCMEEFLLDNNNRIVKDSKGVAVKVKDAFVSAQYMWTELRFRCFIIVKLTNI